MEPTPEEFDKMYASQALSAQTADASTKQFLQHMAYGEAEKGLAEAQLEVETIIENIENLLKGKKVDYLDDGTRVWVDGDNFKILSDWGVQRIMQTVRFHINRNTLLSNFDEKQINHLMLNFCQAMNSLVLLKYEVLFHEATFEECKAIFDKNKDERKKIKMFVKDELGLDYNEKDIAQEIEEELEHRIHEEIEKIKEEQLSLRLKEYDLLLEEIEAQVYATYNRAYAGEERGSLRRHTNFSDIRTSSPPSQQKQGGGVFSWLTGK